MQGKSSNYPLASIFKGVDKLATQSGDRLAKADNFISDGSLVKRRGGWSSVMGGPPLYDPPGKTIVFENGILAAETPSRVLTGFSLKGTYIYIGCYRPFDGIEWGDVLAFNGTGGNVRLIIQYSQGGVDWTNIPYVLDETVTINDSTGSRFPLSRTGKIHWHTGLLDNTGDTPLVNPAWWRRSIGVLPSLYWVRLSVVDDDDGSTLRFSDYSITFGAPGIRTFRREAINGIFPYSVANSQQFVIGGDRGNVRETIHGDQPEGVFERPMESGAAICLSTGYKRPTQNLNLTYRKGSGIMGVVAYPLALGPLDVPGTINSGVAGEIADQSQITGDGYLEKQPFGARMFQNISISAGTVNTFATTDIEIRDLPQGALEGYLVEVQTTGGGGPVIGQHRMVTRFDSDGSSGYFELSDDFASALNASCTIRILHPSDILKVSANDYMRDKEVLIGGASLSARTIVTETTRDYSANLATLLSYYSLPGLVHFSLMHPLNKVQKAGKRYTAIIDDRTKQLVLANGDRLLTYDGHDLTYLQAAPADDPLVEALTSRTATETDDGVGTAYIPATALFYTEPPKGHLVTEYAGRIVVSDGERIFNSYPHQGTNVWPRAFTYRLNTDDGNKIVGMLPVYDKLMVWTTTAIFEGGLSQEGKLVFRPITKSFGFINHHTVQAAPLNGQDVLVGLSSDGISILAGGQPQQIMDDWERLIEGGVNTNALSNAVGAVWRDKGLAAWAVPQSGRTYNNILIVYDYIQGNWWTWTLPFGCSFLNVATDTQGVQELYLGTDDGFVMVYRDNMTDDGVAITGVLKTHPMQPGGANHVAFSRINLLARALGATQPITFTTYVDGNQRPHVTGDVILNSGEAQWNGAGTLWNTSLWATPLFRSTVVNLPSGSRGRTIELELTTTRKLQLRSIEMQWRQLGSGNV